MENKEECKERIMIFIDGSNHYHVIKNIFRSSKRMIDFSFEKFVKYLAGNRKIIRTYYYNTPLDRLKDEKTYMKQQQFFDKIMRIPNFKLILCRLQKQKINDKIIYFVKEDDIHLAVDMVKLAYNDAYDTAILVSTDGDFVPAVNAVQEKGKKVENIGFTSKFSYHLKQVCDDFKLLDKRILDSFFD